MTSLRALHVLQLFPFFFVVLKYDEQQEQKYAETKLETKETVFMEFSI